jgi:hypothetical protein
MPYDSYSMSSVAQALPPVQFNPYAAEEHNALAGPSAGYYHSQNAYTAPPQPVCARFATMKSSGYNA